MRSQRINYICCVCVLCVVFVHFGFHRSDSLIRVRVLFMFIVHFDYILWAMCKNLCELLRKKKDERMMIAKDHSPRERLLDRFKFLLRVCKFINNQLFGVSSSAPRIVVYTIHQSSLLLYHKTLSNLILIMVHTYITINIKKYTNLVCAPALNHEAWENYNSSHGLRTKLIRKEKKTETHRFVITENYWVERKTRFRHCTHMCAIFSVRYVCFTRLSVCFALCLSCVWLLSISRMITTCVRQPNRVCSVVFLLCMHTVKPPTFELNIMLSA